MEYTLYFNGLCEPNPGGIATAAWFLAQDGVPFDFHCQEVRRGRGATNNVAAYFGLGLGLKAFLDRFRAEEEADPKLTCAGDSQLVIRQMTGKWECNAENLKELRKRCLLIDHQLTKLGVTVIYQWISGEENSVADGLSRFAYEQARGKDDDSNTGH